MKMTLIASLLGLAFAAGSAQATVATPVCAVPNGQATVNVRLRSLMEKFLN